MYAGHTPGPAYGPPMHGHPWGPHGGSAPYASAAHPGAGAAYGAPYAAASGPAGM